MSAPRTLDVSALEPCDLSNNSPLWWGQFLMCIIEAVLFSMLIGVYFYLRLGLDVWPPPGARPPNVLLASLALIPLLASCAGSYWADEAAKKNDRKAMILGMVLNLVLAIGFLAFRALEWNSFNFTWASDVHGSIVWTILFLHTYDIIADLLVTAVLLVIVVRGRYGQAVQIGVHVDSVLWYFLAIAWFPLYAVVYWSPHFLGGAR